MIRAKRNGKKVKKTKTAIQGYAPVLMIILVAPPTDEKENKRGDNDNAPDDT
jgi:hypothetical protein